MQRSFHATHQHTRCNDSQQTRSEADQAAEGFFFLVRDINIHTELQQSFMFNEKVKVPAERFQWKEVRTVRELISEQCRLKRPDSDTTETISTEKWFV